MLQTVGCPRCVTRLAFIPRLPGCFERSVESRHSLVCYALALAEPRFNHFMNGDKKLEVRIPHFRNCNVENSSIITKPIADSIVTLLTMWDSQQADLHEALTLDHHQAHGLLVVLFDSGILLALWGLRRRLSRKNSFQGVCFDGIDTRDVGGPIDPLREVILYPWEWRLMEKRDPR